MNSISEIDIELNNLSKEEEELTSKLEEIRNKRESLINKLESVEFAKYDNCDHIWAFYNESQCGCIKCGLDKRVLTENISTKEERLMRKYLLNNINVFNSGLNIKIGHPYKKVRSLYNLTKSKHPMLEDERIVELINISPVVDVKAEARKKLKKL